MTPRLRLHFPANRLAALFLLPVLIALALQAALLGAWREDHRFDVSLERVRAARADELQAAFAEEAYGWPPSMSVPRLSLKRLPRDLDLLPVDEKKTLFFRLVLPLVIAENQRVLNQRALLQSLFTGELAHGSGEYELVARLAREYRVNGDLNAPQPRALLLQRVDVVPPSLALAQAAVESAWGTSRFARDGNSLFGQWTWVRGEGLVPLRRAAGKGHLVRSFTDLRGGVRSYLNNLNVNRAYGRFRHLRARLREAGKPLDPVLLASGLAHYSERGTIYVQEIRRLMQDNLLLILNEELSLHPL